MVRALLLMLLLVAGTAHAAVYKWTDEHGNVHFSDTPPPKAAREKVDVRTGNTMAAPQSASASDGDSLTGNKPHEDESGGGNRTLECAQAISKLERFLPEMTRMVQEKEGGDEAKRQKALEGLTELRNDLRSNIRRRNMQTECVETYEEHRTEIQCTLNSPDASTMMLCLAFAQAIR